jgi:hypothetical protein
MGFDGVPVGSAPPSVLPGASLTLHGTGFGVYENNRTVDIRWGMAGPSLGAATVADDGSWTLTVAVPTDARPGSYILNADAHDDAGFVVTLGVNVVAAAGAKTKTLTPSGVRARYVHHEAPAPRVASSRSRARPVAQTKPATTPTHALSWRRPRAS